MIPNTPIAIKILTKPNNQLNPLLANQSPKPKKLPLPFNDIEIAIIK
ncbi:MAG: hypothetical protein RR266_04000 [Bacilli bacterium]